MTTDQIESFFARATFSAQIAITQYCDLRCKPCGACCGPHLPRTYMGDGFVNNLLKRISLSKKWNKIVCLTGGEALTRGLTDDKKVFENIFSFAKDWCVFVGIKSNATIVNKPEWKVFRKELIKYNTNAGLDISLNDFTAGSLENCANIVDDLKRTRADLRITYSNKNDSWTLFQKLSKKTKIKARFSRNTKKIYLGKYHVRVFKGLWDSGRAKENGLGTHNRTLEYTVKNKNWSNPTIQFDADGTASIMVCFDKYCTVPFIEKENDKMKMRMLDDVIADMKQLMLSEYVTNYSR
jgi:hypothetical protein